MNKDQDKLLELLKEGKTLLMLAPSFPIDFSYPEIIGMCRKMGFDKVTELTYGARMTNYWYVEYIKNHPAQKYYITSPCPVIVQFTKAQYPTLLPDVISYASPMQAMAKICKKNYPEHKIVFCSPCQAKRILEVPRSDGLVDLVITFTELRELLALQGIDEKDFKEKKYQFDSFFDEETKIYPISGGLAKSAHIQKFFKPEEIFIAEEIEDIKPVFDELVKGTSQYRFFDLLNCPGGCIGGPDIASKNLSIEERRQKVLGYFEATKKEQSGPGSSGKPQFEDDLDFGAKL